MWFGKGVVVGEREGGGGETAGPRPSGAYPPFAVTTPLAHSDSWCSFPFNSFPLQNFFHQQRAAAISFGRAALQPLVAACLALGDNVLSVPRKRERTVVCRLLSHSVEIWLMQDAASGPLEREEAEPGQEDEDPLLSEEEVSEDDEDSIDPTVFQVACGTCGRMLSQRGMMVCLITDPSKSLYSTDIPTDGIREHGAPRTIETCECLIRRVTCSSCEHEVTDPTPSHHAIPPLHLFRYSTHVVTDCHVVTLTL